MKSNLIILLSILQSICSTGMEFQDLRSALNSNRIDSILAITKEKKYNLVYQNEIIGNYQSTLITCDSCIEKGNMIYCHVYYLRVISFNQEVVYYSFGRGKNYSSQSNVTYQNVILFNKLSMEYSEFFTSQIDLAELFNNSIVFGTYCGLNSRLLPYRKTLNSYVARKRIKRITKWLLSSNIELQMFAIDGFYQLQTDMKIKISPETMKIISYILSRNCKLKYCAGCFTWYKEISKFHEVYEFK